MSKSKSKAKKMLPLPEISFLVVGGVYKKDKHGNTFEVFTHIGHPKPCSEWYFIDLEYTQLGEEGFRRIEAYYGHVRIGTVNMDIGIVMRGSYDTLLGIAEERFK